MKKNLIVFLILAFLITSSLPCFSKTWKKSDFDVLQNKVLIINKISLNIDPVFIKKELANNETMLAMFKSIPLDRIIASINEKFGLTIENIDELKEFQNGNNNLEYEKLPMNWGGAFFYKTKKESVNDLYIEISYQFVNDQGWKIFFVVNVFQKNKTGKKDIIIKSCNSFKGLGSYKASLADLSDFIINPPQMTEKTKKMLGKLIEANITY